jgi:hypothetical protein
VALETNPRADIKGARSALLSAYPAALNNSKRDQAGTGERAYA